MNSACDVAPDELIAFTEEELPERRMKQLEAHVPGCPHCQQRLADSRATMMLLRDTMPEPEPHQRHDLLVRLYEEAGQQTDRPHRQWTQVASLTAVGGTFLIAAFLLWTGLGQLIDAIPQPVQRASPDQSIQWVNNGQTTQEVQGGRAPATIGETFQLGDQQTQAGITTLIYHSTEFDNLGLEVIQFPDDDAEPPTEIDQIQTSFGIPIQVDNPEAIREFRWVSHGMAHHAQLTALESDAPAWLTPDQTESIVQAFLD
jgi:hypothetical protein